VNKYLVKSYRWAGGEIRERVPQNDYVSADRFEVESYESGATALFYSDTQDLIAVYTNFDSVVLVTE
jgi:hypothetical protein